LIADDSGLAKARTLWIRLFLYIYIYILKIPSRCSSVTIAKDIANDIGVNALFPVKRKAVRNKQFDENSCHEEILENERAFEVNYFLVLVDMASTSLRTRFEELSMFKGIFRFFIELKQTKVTKW
jgi:hypothetical protein